MKPITPFLWCNGDAEALAQHYTAIFQPSRVVEVVRMPASDSAPDGAVLTVSFELRGQPFVALNGGPTYTFSPAISFVVEVDSQAECDHYWDALLAGGGKPGRCGWLTDRFGVSWQVVPRRLLELMRSRDPGKAAAVTAAMLTMGKLDVAALEAAGA